MYKLSVIVPIYNQEKYLRTSIQSIINQTFGFENIELILLDNCSTDSSKDIILEFSENYENIIPILFKENSGEPGTSRNKGLEISSGQYIMFFDPDDYLMEDICETLYNKIIKENADIVSGNAIAMVAGVPYYDIDFKSDPREVIYSTKNYSDYKEFRVWGSLYKKDFLTKNNIKFLDMTPGEDTYFQQKCFFKQNKICYLDKYYGYIYFIRNNNSITNTNNTKKSIYSSYYCRIITRKMLINEEIKLEYDPLLSVLYSPFSSKWNLTKNEEIEYFKKILDYKNQIKLPVKLPISYKIPDILIERQLFYLTYIYHNLFVIITRFIKLNYRTKIDKDEEIYKKVIKLKDW